MVLILLGYDQYWLTESQKTQINPSLYFDNVLCLVSVSVVVDVTGTKTKVLRIIIPFEGGYWFVLVQGISENCWLGISLPRGRNFKIIHIIRKYIYGFPETE